MIETMIASAAAKKLLENASASTLMDSVWDGIVDFMADQAKSLGQKEALERISRLRSDAKIRQEIQAAIERAVVRWSDDYHDRELVTAVAENTTFADLPSVQQAARGVAQRPYDPEIIRTLEKSFGDVLPSRFEKHRVEAGVSAFLEVLQEEFAGIAALRDALRIFAALETSRHTGALPQILAALERLEKGPTPTEATLHKYLSWVIDQHRYLDPRGTMQTSRQVQVPLAEIFVTLDAEIEPLLATTDRRIYEKELEELMRREDLRPEEKEDLRENLLAGYLRDAQTNSSQEKVELGQALNNATSTYRVLEALVESLSDPNVGVRREAAIALRNAIGEPWVIDALLEALGDPNETVRRAAAEALRKASDEPRVLEILLEALGDRNDTVRRAVARVIEDATDKPWVLETLLTAIADPSEALRSAAVQALSKAWDEPRVLEALLEALGDPSDVVRRAAVEALKKQTDEPRVLEVVLAALADPSDSVRCAVVDALRKHTDEPRVIEALLASLADSNDGVRSTAATVLENEIDKPRVIQALLIALTDPSDQVRKAAAYSLKPFGHRVDVVSAMLKWMEDIADEPERFDYEHEYPVYFAAFVLLDAEPQPEILNRLLKLYMKGNESVKSAAIFAIRELVKKPRAGVDEEFKRTIRSSFDDPNIHEVGISLLEYEKNRRSWAKGLYPNLFETLAAITPGPTVN